MLKHFQRQNRRSFRQLALQIALALAGGVIWFLVSGLNHGAAFACGVLAVAAGQMVQSLVSFSGGVQGAGTWFGRFLLATLLKWIVVFAAIAFCINRLHGAPIALLAGFAASLLVIQLFNFYDAKVKRGS
jgi:hypothetical protein